ncbi:hypothetical protein D3C72_921160 [compost metagenome]
MLIDLDLVVCNELMHIRHADIGLGHTPLAQIKVAPHSGTRLAQEGLGIIIAGLQPVLHSITVALDIDR